MLKKLFSALSAQSKDTGKQGEDLACRYLKKHGFTILERNWKSHPYEIDIICLDNSTKELVFAEVKTRKESTLQPAREQALQAFTRKKQNNIIKGAKHYLTLHEKWDCPCRFDFISVNGNTKNVEHFTHVIIQ